MQAALDDLLDEDDSEALNAEFEVEMGGLTPRERVVRAVNSYIREVEDTESNILGFLARRPNMVMAATIVGLCACGQSPNPLDVKELGKYLTEKGFKLRRQRGKITFNNALTPEIFMERRKNGLSQAAIAREFEVTGEAISYLKRKWLREGLINESELEAM